MTIEIHLGPDPERGSYARKILLTRCQSNPESNWVATSFNKDINTYDGQPVDHRFKSLQTGALPGLVKWLVRNQLGGADTFPLQVSKQLDDLITQSPSRRKKTWLSALVGGDPIEFFERQNGNLLPNKLLKNAKVVTTKYQKIQKSGNLYTTSRIEMTDPTVLQAVANSVNPPNLSITVQSKACIGAPDSWEDFRPGSDELAHEHELKIDIGCIDGEPRHIAVALLSANNKNIGIWPWNPKAPRGWDSNEEIERIIREGRNPKVEVSFPDRWNQIMDAGTPDKIKASSRIQCILAFIYRLDYLEPTNTHAELLQQLTRTIKSINFDELQNLPPKPRRVQDLEIMHFRIGPFEDDGYHRDFWNRVKSLPGEIVNCFQRHLETNQVSLNTVEFADAWIIVSKDDRF